MTKAGWTFTDEFTREAALTACAQAEDRESALGTGLTIIIPSQ